MSDGKFVWKETDGSYTVGCSMDDAYLALYKWLGAVEYVQGDCNFPMDNFSIVSDVDVVIFEEKFKDFIHF